MRIFCVNFLTAQVCIFYVNPPFWRFAYLGVRVQGARENENTYLWPELALVFHKQLANQQTKTKQNTNEGETPSQYMVTCPQCGIAMNVVDPVLCDCVNPMNMCQLQSEEVLLAPLVQDMASMEEQTTAFMDSSPGRSVGMNMSPLDYELADAQVSADLGDFLSRPVRLYSETWTQAQAVGTWINNRAVWYDYLNQPAIKNKLQNYAFFRGNLKLKIVTNASPFLYGSLRAVYQPLPNFNRLGATSSFPSAFVPLSQLPGVWITPAHSEGAEFTCPFIWPRSFARSTLTSDIADLGYLDLVVYNQLRSANGTTSSVTVQVYAWMEDVVLAGPTLGAALQADEYGVGVVSAPASAVAAIAQRLTDLPVIGRFAKATQIGASAVSKVATLFGFTDVPVIEDTRPVRNSPFPQLATAAIGYTHEKLALDPKNELSIDPQIAGCSSDDELAIAHFAQRESFLVGTDWSTSQVPDTPLFTSRVTPELGFVSGDTYDFTPMGLLSTMFNNWRGDVIFRFKFIATPFHKGRVRISYDPASPTVQTTGDTGPYVFNKIVDLGAETDVEFRVPYQQALPWCYTRATLPSDSYTVSTTPAITLTDTFHNGILSMKVLTALTAPVNTSSVGIQVFVRAAENIEFANPVTGEYDYTPFTLQSNVYYDDGSTTSGNMGVSSSEPTKRELVNFGESVRSLRTLMRRKNYLDTVQIPGHTANTNGVFEIIQTRFPAFYGYDPAGWNTAKGILAPTTNFNFNFAKMSPWHLIAPCFLTQRGSMHWTYNPARGAQPITSRISRYNYTYPGYLRRFVEGPTTNTNIIMANYWKNTTATGAGSSLTHTNTTNGHSVAAPSYSPFKFQTTDPRSATSPASVGTSRYDGTVYDSLIVEFPFDSNSNAINGFAVERYFSIGTDYTLNFFMCCPTLRFLAAATIVPV